MRPSLPVPPTTSTLVNSACGDEKLPSETVSAPRSSSSVNDAREPVRFVMRDHTLSSSALERRPSSSGFKMRPSPLPLSLLARART